MYEKDWDRIINGYKFSVSPPEEYEGDLRIQTASQRMLDLITLIRSHPLLGKAKPGTVHEILTLRVPKTYRNIHIYWIEPGEYSIWLDFSGDTAETFWGDKTGVSPEDVIDTLELYTQCLQEEAESP
jgi:hypothetical protein